MGVEIQVIVACDQWDNDQDVCESEFSMESHIDTAPLDPLHLAAQLFQRGWKIEVGVRGGYELVCPRHQKEQGG